MSDIPLTVEPGRLSRGIELGVRQLGPRQFIVQGSHAPWYVDLDVDPPCTCPDMEYRGSKVLYCKHCVAALMHARDPRMLQTVQALLERREEARSS